ncbi:bcl-2-interacting killer isoform X1 [Myotis lucifugus]|uniref:bcl-2-interacting killer isoform X1 n=2 Tax=Myotis lucifugus TaxID=59463 RepID=UPI0006D74694|nr:bcl-2-interacting killer isoform X1 [Myotis lucifugus]
MYGGEQRGAVTCPEAHSWRVAGFMLGELGEEADDGFSRGGEGEGGGKGASLGISHLCVSFFPREDMSQAGHLSRSLILCTFLQEHGLQAVEDPGVTSLLQYSPEPLGALPHEVAMRLAFIGDELEVRWTLPRFAHVPWMAMYSFAHTYNQTGLRVVLTSVMGGLPYLRGNRRFWSFLILRAWVSPPQGRGRKLSGLLLLALLLDWGLHLLQ